MVCVIGILGGWGAGWGCLGFLGGGGVGGAAGIINTRHNNILEKQLHEVKGKKDGDIAFKETVISALMVHVDDDGLF